MANSLRVPDDVKTALALLREFASDPTLGLVGEWYNLGVPAPSFGPASPDSSHDFNEAAQLGVKYEGNSSATRDQVNGLVKAVHELTVLAGKILEAYNEAENDQVKGLADLATAMRTELGTINTDLGGPPEVPTL
jgi:hypothetical protein